MTHIHKKMFLPALCTLGNGLVSPMVFQRKKPAFRIGVVVLMVIGLFLAGSSLAADFEYQFEDDTKIPWRVTADQKVVYDEKTEKLVAQGNVVIEKKDIRLVADEVRYDRVTQTAYAEGNVHLTVGEDVMAGERLEMNLEGETGALHDGTLFIKKSNFYIKAEKILKTGERTYTADRVQITTCDGESPVWDITGRKMDVTVEGYGFVNHAALRVKQVPVLYSPFLAFPVKLKRQTGLLAPQIGSSDRKGFEYTQPFFWAISDSADATFYANLMSRRGEKYGVEYRYIFSEDSKGAMLFDFLDDKKKERGPLADDGTGTSGSDYGYDDDNVLRPNSDRYWFRMKHDHWFDDHTVAKLDLDIVSDQDYLQEFKNGYTGFNDTEDFFYRFLNRELDDYNDPVRKNQFVFNKLWPGYSLNAAVVWWDDVIARRQSNIDDTTQQLPALTFERYKQPLFNSPLYLGLESRYNYFYREDGTEGHRFDVYPRVYLPMRIKNMLTIEPSMGFRQTIWHVDTYDGDDRGRDQTPHRELYDVRLELFSEIYNVFQSPLNSGDKIKHSIRFQTDYEYIPEYNQEEYPVFDAIDREYNQEEYPVIDAIDRIAGRNLITYSVTNTFTRRTTRKDHSFYHQFARLKLEQGFDVTKENDSAKEPFTPLRGELQCDLGSGLYLQTDAEWSTYSSEFLSRNIAARLADRRGDKLFIEHRYTKSLSESILLDALFRLTPKIWLFADFERNIHTGEEIGSGVGIFYQSQCWSLELMYEKEEDDQSIHFVVSLHGLGDIGSGSRGSRIRSGDDEDWF